MEAHSQAAIEDLPVSIRSYFVGRNAGDFGTAVSGFSPAAVVRDEGHRHVGPAAIRAWIESTTARYDDKVEITGVVTDGKEVKVVARVSGAFPGSPITLQFTFTLDGHLISQLRIAP